MIIHQLIRHHLRHRDDAEFYLLQARDAMHWMECCGVVFGAGMTVLDLGCGHGLFGAELARRQCQVVFADETNYLMPQIEAPDFRTVNIDRDDLARLGQYDVVVCSNVYEHLSQPEPFIAAMPTLLRPQGKMYLSWTNWLSPWGGHEFSPFHYLGPRRGHLIYDRMTGKKRIHTPFKDLYPTYIGETLRLIRQHPQLRVINAAPRYYTELAWLLRIPFLREFLAWNCALLIERKGS